VGVDLRDVDRCARILRRGDPNLIKFLNSISIRAASINNSIDPERFPIELATERLLPSHYGNEARPEESSSSAQLNFPRSSGEKPTKSRENLRAGLFAQKAEVKRVSWRNSNSVDARKGQQRSVKGSPR
jgi:hypothetical protein